MKQVEPCQFSGQVTATTILVTLLLATNPDFGESKSLRFTSTRSSKGSFETLEECQAAYDKLEAECQDCRKPTGPSTGASSAGAVETFPVQPTPAPKKPYEPPEGITGRPSFKTGWDYKKHGEDWGKFGVCSGTVQSPIDLSKHVDTPGQTKYVLWFDYYRDPNLNISTKATLINDGHSVRYDVLTNGIDLGFVKIGNEEYEAIEYIFHAPSEHTIDGAVFPLELQIYNKEVEGEGMVAISILFREGGSNDFLLSLMNSVSGLAPRWSKDSGSSIANVTGSFPGAFDLEAIIPKGTAAGQKSFFNYEGSLTQPPCTEGVDWWVLSSPITATREEIRFIRRAIFASPSMRHGNARSTMPMGNRSIFTGLTGFQHYTGPKGLGTFRGYSTMDHPWKLPAFHVVPMPAPAPAPGSSPGPVPGPSPVPGTL